MKKSFTLIEVFILLTLIIVIIAFFQYKSKPNDLEIVAKKLVLYLKQTRYQALIDDKHENKNSLWHKKRWTLKFLRCDKSVGGIYYTIYSDENMKGHPNIYESLKDPLTNKKIYSSNKCQINANTSKYVLLSKEFDIQKIEMSCNNTTSLGQISFGNDGKVYTKLSTNDNEFSNYELTNECIIKLIDSKNKFKRIKIEPKTGYISLEKA